MGRMSHTRLRELVTYDKPSCLIKEGMSKLTYPRNRSMGYGFTDILMSGFAVFSLKYPSLLCFDDQTQTQRQNLMTLYGIENPCSDSHLRKVSDEVNPQPLQKVFVVLYERLSKLGILKSYRVLGGHLICSMDGVHHFESEKVHCAGCQVKKHNDGRVSHSHSMLSAVLVHPDHKEVFPLGTEAIGKRDGAIKNDCEQNAAKRLSDWLLENHKDEGFIMVEDASYAADPHVRQICR